MFHSVLYNAATSNRQCFIGEPMWFEGFMIKLMLSIQNPLISMLSSIQWFQNHTIYQACLDSVKPHNLKRLRTDSSARTHGSFRSDP
jgi:hypothetical protein